jgi:hypothetical protein
MIRGIEQRLRKLELGSTEPQRLRIVFSATSDEADWASQIADLISSGRANSDDEFMRIGWMPESSEGPDQNARG